MDHILILEWGGGQLGVNKENILFLVYITSKIGSTIQSKELNINMCCFQFQLSVIQSLGKKPFLGSLCSFHKVQSAESSVGFLSLNTASCGYTPGLSRELGECREPKGGQSRHSIMEEKEKCNSKQINLAYKHLADFLSDAVKMLFGCIDERANPI